MTDYGDYTPICVGHTTRANTPPDTLTREEADARVAAALREAAELHEKLWREGCTSERCREAILALIPDAGKALDRAMAEAVRAEREACARFLEDHEVGIKPREGYVVSLSALKGAQGTHVGMAYADAIRARTEGEDR